MPTRADLAFRTWCDLVRADEGGFVWYPHLEPIADELQLIADDHFGHKLLIVNLPPSHGKTELVSKLLTSYYLWRHPQRAVGVGSHKAALAVEISQHSRNYFASVKGGTLKRGQQLKSRWWTAWGGRMWTTSVGSGYLGSHAHLIVIDDPYGAEMEAAKGSYQVVVERWWQAMQSRLKRIGDLQGDIPLVTILVHQRLARHDQTGRLLDKETKERKGEIRLLYAPAITPDASDHGPPRPDTVNSTLITAPKSRPGDALEPSIITADEVNRMDPLTATALYLQNPTLGGAGDYFARKDFREWPFPWPGRVADVPMRVGGICRAWDFAYSATPTSDFTCGVLAYRLDLGADEWSHRLRDDFGVNEEFVIVFAEMRHLRVEPRKLEMTVCDQALLDGPQVQVSIPVDPAAGAKLADDMETAIRDYCQKHGEFEPADIVLAETGGGKIAKSSAYRRLAHQGRVFYKTGTWAVEFIDQHVAFQGGDQPGHDDIVDAASDDVRALTDRLPAIMF